MFLMKFFIRFLLLLPLSVWAQSTIIKDVNVLDVENEKVLRATSVRIADGRIDFIGKFSKLQPGSEDRVIEGAGKYLIPGLIDSHIHFFQSGGIYTRPDAMDLTQVFPYEKEIRFAKDNAIDYMKRYLRNGITSVMDVGGPMWNYTVRDTLASTVVSPNILVTGPLFSMVSRPQLDKGDPPIIKVSTETDVLKLFNEQLPYKPDFIKVWYVVTAQTPADKTYPLVAYLGELCRENKLKLAVHATQLETARLSVKAGANILVHSVDNAIIPSDFVKELKDNQVTYIPTLTVTDGYIKAFTGEINHDPQDLKWANPMAYSSLMDPNKIERKYWPESLKARYGSKRPPGLQVRDSIMRVNLARLYEAGVNVATGTDAGNIGTMHASSYLPELLAMQKAGLSNWELLISSTINPAKGFDIDDQVGSVKKGKVADLVLLNKDPLDDIRNITEIAMVMKSGEVLAPDTFLIETAEQVVQRQLNAYNARNIDAFLDTYSEDVEIYGEDGKLLMKGHDQMRSGYAGMFERVTNLYCEIRNRIIINNKVIDHEKVRFNDRFLDAVAVYEVNNGKITKVNFIK